MTIRNFWLISFFSFLFSPVLHAEASILRVCYEDISNPPLYYSSRATRPEKPGITVELLQAASKDLGLNLQFQQMPWKRCIKALEKNLVDAAFDFSYKPAREDYAVYPYHDGELDLDRYLHELSYYLFTLKDSKLRWDGTAFNDKQARLVAVAGYSIVEDLRLQGYTVVEGANQRSNLAMLLKGRADGVAHFASTTNAIIQQQPDLYRRVLHHNIPLKSKLYYLVFGKEYYANNKASAEKMWDRLKYHRLKSADEWAKKYVDE